MCLLSAPALAVIAVAGLAARLLWPDGRLAPWVPSVGSRRCLNNPGIMGCVAAKRGSQGWTEVSRLIVGV